MTKVFHKIPPIYDENSKVLILGTMPSVKSRELNFYYAHPKNRFWKVLEAIFDEEIIDKRSFVLKKRIALWDCLESCEIKKSSDSSIRNEKPNDITKILNESSIKVIFTTGKTAHKYYQKYFKELKVEEINLPSTSPANCKISFDELVKNYGIIKKYLN